MSQKYGKVFDSLAGSRVAGINEEIDSIEHIEQEMRMILRPQGFQFEISISISQNADTLTLHTDNTCAGTSEGRYGTGLRNLKRRLELLYPGKHTFLSWREESRFLTELILKL